VDDYTRDLTVAEWARWQALLSGARILVVPVAWLTQPDTILLCDGLYVMSCDAYRVLTIEAPELGDLPVHYALEALKQT
jgi:hypothetical protein